MKASSSASFVGIIGLLLLAPFSLSLKIAQRNSFRVNRAFLSKLISTAAIASCLNIPRANAFGPTEIDMKITSYKQVELCSGKKPIMPGQKAALGLFPVW